MTPLREVVVLLPGNSIAMTVKDEVNDIEQHTQDVLMTAAEKPSWVQLGGYTINMAYVCGWYFRNYVPDLYRQQQTKSIEFMDKAVRGEFDE